VRWRPTQQQMCRAGRPQAGSLPSLVRCEHGGCRSMFLSFMLWMHFRYFGILVRTKTVKVPAGRLLALSESHSSINLLPLQGKEVQKWENGIYYSSTGRILFYSSGTATRKKLETPFYDSFSSFFWNMRPWNETCVMDFIATGEENAQSPGHHQC
jgi:hypothetical protein